MLLPGCTASIRFVKSHVVLSLRAARFLHSMVAEQPLKLFVELWWQHPGQMIFLSGKISMALVNVFRRASVSSERARFGNPLGSSFRRQALAGGMGLSW